MRRITPAAFASYEREIGDYVRRSREFAISAAKRLVPARRFDLWMLVSAARVINLLPGSVSRAIAKLNTGSLRLHDTISLKDYTQSYSDRRPRSETEPSCPQRITPTTHQAYR